MFNILAQQRYADAALRFAASSAGHYLTIILTVTAIVIITTILS